MRRPWTRIDSVIVRFRKAWTVVFLRTRERPNNTARIYCGQAPNKSALAPLSYHPYVPKRIEGLYISISLAPVECSHERVGLEKTRHMSHECTVVRFQAPRLEQNYLRGLSPRYTKFSSIDRAPALGKGLTLIVTTSSQWRLE